MIYRTWYETRKTGIQTQQGWETGDPFINVALIPYDFWNSKSNEDNWAYVTKYQTKTTGIQTSKGLQKGAPLINVALILYDLWNLIRTKEN